MDLRRALLSSLLVLGFFGLAVFLGEDAPRDFEADEYCQSIEDEFYQSSESPGDLSCYTPGSPEVENINVSHELDDRTDLACICTYDFEGDREIISINIPN